MAENRQNITPQQRAQLFATNTRQNMHMLSQQKTTQEFSTFSFEFPKSRYLACVFVHVKATLNLKHASTTKFNTTPHDIANMFRRVALDLNTGFMPFVCSGKELMLYNYVATNVNMINPASNAWNNVPAQLTASSSGTDNNVEFTFKLPLTMSGRDMPGLVLLQNQPTTVTLNMDLGNGADVIKSDGLTTVIKSCDVSVMLETFSIPVIEAAQPDLSVLKLVNGRIENLPAAGQHIIKIQTGTIYRKLILSLSDDKGNPAELDFISSPIEIVFNQADTTYQITPEMLKAMNEMNLNINLPKGMFVFDFSAGGFLPNYGGVRDLIDTAKLTEFWLRFSTSKAGSLDLVTEQLTRVASR